MCHRMFMPVTDRFIRQKPRHLCIGCRHMAQNAVVVVAVLVIGSEVSVGMTVGEVLVGLTIFVDGHNGTATPTYATHFGKIGVARGIVVNLCPFKNWSSRAGISYARHELDPFSRPGAPPQHFAIATNPKRICCNVSVVHDRTVMIKLHPVTVSVQRFESCMITATFKPELFRRTSAQIRM